MARNRRTWGLALLATTALVAASYGVYRFVFAGDTPGSDGSNSAADDDDSDNQKQRNETGGASTAAEPNMLGVHAIRRGLHLHRGANGGGGGSGGVRPKLTLGLNGIIIRCRPGHPDSKRSEADRDRGDNRYILRPEGLALVSELGRHFDLYLLATVPSRDDQDDIRRLLLAGEAAHVFHHREVVGVPAESNHGATTTVDDTLAGTTDGTMGSPGRGSLVQRDVVDARKLLFCQTDAGKVHMVRHIDPVIHVDTAVPTLLELLPFIPYLYWLRQAPPPPPSDPTALVKLQNSAKVQVVDDQFHCVWPPSP
ncbi:hypothetical protein IWQ60_000049 [Tieghemiomyces parasiticus]|uniref:Uncharacterized protein n=1 Tax=Tieghemiomyces parasiticus TaxID=78921 RepID=A0A9W8AGZ4_9FUNG|nr:hypothetical protein IWQ60_000049 [Tieghemiomyces parasiticus]